MHLLRTINAMSAEEFTETFGGVYESSPWVAARAWSKLPFATALTLQTSLRETVETASVAEQEALILAHPDLAGKLARAGQLTEASTREQSRLGLDRLDEPSFALFDQLNQQYRQRFHFPFIICVGRLQNQAQVLQAFRTRITHSPDEERREALDQIHHIATLRLAALVKEFTPP
jgi:2-oxo-4-hydroxy-4-carboxy-5-ureidoimidazoline decarboxylase